MGLYVTQQEGCSHNSPHTNTSTVAQATHGQLVGFKQSGAQLSKKETCVYVHPSYPTTTQQREHLTVWLRLHCAKR